MKKLRWGVLSTAKIGREQVIPAINASQYGEVTAIASRDQDRAVETAESLDIGKVYGDYDTLLADPDIDAIYNPLPNHLHIPYSIKALTAGKHVLCEKPIGTNAAEVNSLIAHAQKYPRLKIMEAFMYRFHPQWQQVITLIRNDSIGQIRHIHSHFSYNNRDNDNIRNFQAMGGGGLLDIGCYCISLARFLYSEEPLKVISQITPYAGYEVDCFATGILEFADGSSTFNATTKSEDAQYVQIHGEQGFIQIPRPFNPKSNEPTQIIITRNKEIEILVQPPSNQYSAMCDAFAQSILLDHNVPTPLNDALANSKVIDALFASAQSQTWITL